MYVALAGWLDSTDLSCSYSDGSTCTFDAQANLLDGDCTEPPTAQNGTACYSASLLRMN